MGHFWTGVDKRVQRDNDDGSARAQWVRFGTELSVLALTRNNDSEEWGRLLETVDRDGTRHRWAMAVPTLDSLKADLLALIRDLENAPRYQTRSQHWTKAHIAGLLREALGMEVPPCENRHAFAVYEARAIDDFKRYSKNYPGGLGAS